MAKCVFVTGTDTDVGKTVVSACYINELIKSNKKVCYFKPIASGCITNEGKEVPSDINFISELTGFNEKIDMICSFYYKTPVSPHLASKIENNIISIDVILEKYNEIKNKYDYVVVEGCGGVFVPLNNEKYLVSDLIKEMDIPCVVVSRAGVGTINHTGLTIDYLNRNEIKVNGIIINNYSGEFYEVDNVEMIEELTKIKVLFKLQNITNFENVNYVKEIFSKAVDIDVLINTMD